MSYLIKNSFNLMLFILYVCINPTSAGQTYIGGVNAWNANGDGTICSPNIGVNSTQTPTSYSCTVALNDGGFSIFSVDAITITTSNSNYQPPNQTQLESALSQIKSESIALGNQTSTYKSGDVALGNNSKTTAVVATPSSSVAGTTYNHAGNNPTNAVAVGESGKERVIQSVAAGRISETSTDAVNGSQLYAAYDAINSIYQRQMAGYDSEIKQINQDIDQLKEGAYAGIAGAMAIGNLPQPSTPGKNMISGGMGTYKGHSAAAFGFSSVTENDKVIWKIGASFDSNRNSGGAASIGYQW